MGRRVDAARQAARDDDTAPGELGTEPLADLPGVVSRGPGPDDGDRRLCASTAVSPRTQRTGGGSGMQSRSAG